MFLADILWSLAKVGGYYLPGGLQDILYLACYLPLAAAGREQMRAIGSAVPESKTLDALARSLPYAAMLTALLVLIHFTRVDIGGPATVMTMIVFGLTLLLMVRQAIILREDALTRERRAARVVEDRYASLIANASDVIMIVAADGALRFASPASERMLGLRPEDTSGTNLLDHWAGDDAERLKAFLAEVAATPQGTVGPVELRIECSPASFVLEIVGSNLMNDPAVNGLALNFRDISERKALEEQQRSGGRDVPRPRQFQEHQRYPGPRRRRPAAAGDRPAARQNHALLRHGVATSIGVAFSTPDAGAEALLSNADIAMYHAKAAGKNRFVVFQPKMQQVLHERLRLEADLSRALDNHEFFIEYQPIVDLGTRSLLGVEALVRWRHPEDGVLLPGRFIHIAEECGQVMKLGRWVLMQACRDLYAWRNSVAGGAGLRVAVNISGRHLQHGDLVQDVAEALRESGLEPGNLVIELTESSMMYNTDANLERLRQLKALGVKLAIDDFGTGYSSLSYLHRFPIDILKIDRSFVSRLTNSDNGPELARAVITLGETLGLDTVAEGIELEPEVAALLALGCVAGQGFLFAKAGSLEQLSSSSFVARRTAHWTAQAEREDLSATGRFKALKRVGERAAGGA